MILVDSNVIIDLISKAPIWGAWSRDAVAEAADGNALAINPIIYAEVSVGFATVNELEEVLGPVEFRRLPLPYEAGFLAGKAHLDYRRRGGLRSSPMPDFYIGAHAAVSGLTLLTRDRRRYASYFPTLRIIAPEAG